MVVDLQNIFVKGGISMRNIAKRFMAMLLVVLMVDPLVAQSNRCGKKAAALCYIDIDNPHFQCHNTP